MPALGTFVLHSMANPPLKAGDYTLTGQVTVERVDGSSVGAIDPQATNLRITSPRYRLPPDQLLSTFPPANAVGAFSARLPQAVIKRRTLPWEREPAPGAANTPWLALVVIAEGEGTLSGDVPIAECVTPGVNLTGPNDVATGTYLSVTRTVIDKVFPMKDELALLCHVREVDVRDTELAAGDDDGFLSVVIANRLPQYDRAGDKPVRYMACLVNLEGQLESLAKQQPKVFEYLTNERVFDYRAALPAAGDADHLVMGHAATAAAFNTLAVRGASGPRGAPRAARADAPGRDGESPAKRATGPAAANKSTASQWATTTAKIETAGLTSAANEAGRLVRDGMREGYRGNLEHLFPAEKVYRFPVLANWSFTVGDDGGFDVLMQRLDVGLLGTEPAAPKLRPGSVPPPPPPPEPRPPAEFTETGHVGLPHLTRGGERVRAWYRGPLGTSPTERDGPDPATTPPGRLPFAHVSDQLRRVVPDGREDLSLAAAFEIGRLLALSQPSLVRALLAWRGEQFGAARSRGFFGVMSDAPGLVKALKGAGAAERDGAAGLLSRHLVTQAGARPAKVFAKTRPVADPGRALPYAREGGLDKLIAEGFGFTTAQVQEFRQGAGSALSLQRVAVPLGKRAADAPLLEGAAIERLRGALGVDVDRLTADSIGQQVPGGVGGGGIGGTGPQVGPRARRRGAAPAAARAAAPHAVEPDALDNLIARATTARRRNP